MFQKTMEIFLVQKVHTKNNVVNPDTKRQSFSSYKIYREMTALSKNYKHSKDIFIFHLRK